MSLAKRLVKNAAERVGVTVTRSGGWDLHRQRRELLRLHGITLALDVGANSGQYGRRLRAWSGYTGRIVSFEPVASAYAELRRTAAEDAKWETRECGLSDSAGLATINVPVGHSDLSSLSTFTNAGARLAERSSCVGQTVRLLRLDDVVQDVARADDRILLKMDVQGHESLVLAGAPQTLARALLVECELPLIPLYQGQSLVRLISQLSAAGFSPVGITSNYIDRSAGIAMDADGIFVRSELLRL